MCRGIWFKCPVREGIEQLFAGDRLFWSLVFNWTLIRLEEKRLGHSYWEICFFFTFNKVLLYSKLKYRFFSIHDPTIVYSIFIVYILKLILTWKRCTWIFILLNRFYHTCTASCFPCVTFKRHFFKFLFSYLIPETWVNQSETTDKSKVRRYCPEQIFWRLFVCLLWIVT